MLTVFCSGKMLTPVTQHAFANRPLVDYEVLILNQYKYLRLRSCAAPVCEYFYVCTSYISTFVLALLVQT